MISENKSELKIASGLLCLLLTVGILPVLVWHSWPSLEGPAKVGLLGFLIADLALWYSARLVSTGHSGLVRAVALACEGLLAALLLVIVASVLAFHGSDKRTEQAAERLAKIDRERLAAIKEHARELAATSGQRLSRAFMESTKQSPAPVSPALPEEETAWKQIFPAWWFGWGVVALPSLTGLAILMILFAMVGLAPQSESNSDSDPTLPIEGAAYRLPAHNYAQKRRPTPTPIQAPTPSAGGGGVVLERKPDGRTEAWRKDPTARRGKTYLTSWNGQLTEEEEAERIASALVKKGVG